MSQPEFKSEPIPTGPSESVVVEPEVEAVKETPEVQKQESGVIMQTPPSQVTSDQTTQAVADDTTTPIVTITIPATPQQLEDWSKGSADDSLTWVAFFWIRMIKKALYYGWRVVTGGAAQLSA